MSLYASGSNYKDGSSNTTSSTNPGPTITSPPASSRTATTACAISSSAIYHTETNPVAVERGECSGSSELGGNHCGSLHNRFTLAPGEETRFVFMLGVGSRDEAGHAIRASIRTSLKVDEAFAALARLLEAQEGRPAGARLRHPA